MQDANDLDMRRTDNLMEEMLEDEEGRPEAGALEDLQWLKATGKKATMETLYMCPAASEE